MASVYDSGRKSVYADTQLENRGLPDSAAKEKAAYTVLASTLNSPNSLNLFNQTSRELMSNEASSIEIQALAGARSEHDAARGDAAVGIATNSSVDPDRRAVAIESLYDTDYQPSLIEEATINQGAQYDPTDEDAREVHMRRISDSVLEGVGRRILNDVEITRMVQDLRDGVALDLTQEGDLAELGPELVESILPFTLQTMYNGVAQDLFPEEASRIQAFTLPGETQEFLSQKFKGMTTEELDMFLPMLRDSLKENAGWATENGFLAMDLINSVFAEELTLRAEGDFNWDRMWNNVIGVADSTIVLAPITRSLFRFAKGRSIGRAQAAIDNANPDAAARLRAAVIAEDSEELRGMTGMTAEDAVVDTYPTFQQSVNSNVPANVVSHIENVQTELKKIEEDIAYGINYTQEEISAMQERVLDAWKNKEGSYNQSFSELAMDVEEGRGFSIRAAFGPADGVGFKSVGDALDHFKQNFPQGTPVDFVVRDGDTVRPVRGDALQEMIDEGQNIRTYSRKADARRGALRAGVQEGMIDVRQLEDGRWTWQPEMPEVWYRVKQDYNYNLSLLDENTILFGGPTIDRGFLDTSWIKDPASLFSRFVNRVGIRAHDLGQGVQGRMMDMADRAFNPLNRNSKINVINVLEEGSTYRNEDGSIGRNFTYDDLVGRGMTGDEIRSYYTLRGLMDLEYSLNNMRVYNTLRRDGFVSVVNEERGLEFFGRPVDRNSVITDGRSTRVFDPDSNQIIRMSADDVDRLYESGGMVYRSKTLIENGDEAVSLVARGLGSGTRQRELSLFPLNYRPGYITRFYDENYFVKMKKTQTVDGKRVERWVTVAATPTKVDGDNLIRSLQRQDPDIEYQVQIDRKLSDQGRFDDEFEYLHRTGGVITGRRGDHLAGIENSRAETLDFVESMTKSFTYTAGRVSHDDAIAGLERRWVNTYGKDYNLFAIPDDLTQIKSATASDARVREARQHAAYIQGLKGVQPEYAQKWKSFMIGAAEHVENALGGGRAVMHVGDFLRGFNPIKTLRGLSFNLLLASNPMRQLLLQTNQITLLAGIKPKYIMGGGLSRDFAAFTAAAATRNRPQWGVVKERAGKLLKMSGDDFEKLYDNFVRSGLPQSIDSHTFARDGLQALSRNISGNFATRVGRSTANALKAPMLAAKKVGFDAGEWSNLAMSYLVSWRKFVDDNPGRNWRSRAAADIIATDTREFALNMTKTGELPYQRGILSLATQFLSFQHKALLALTGRNKAFAELPRHKKISMAVTQFAFYGLDGFGLGAQLDRLKDRNGWDIPEEMDPVLRGFVYDYMLNGLIRSITGEDDTDIMFSRALAPASGVLSSWNDLIGNFMTAQSADFMLGASASAIGRVADAAKMVHTTLFDIPDLSNPERLQAVLQQGGQIFGGYSNYLKGQAMRTVGYYVSNSGVPLFKQTFAESWARSLFGIGSASQEDFFRIQSGMNGPYAPGSVVDKLKPLSDSDVQEIAETYYERVLKVYRDMSFSTGDTVDRGEYWEQTLQAKLALENTIFAVLPEDVAYAVRRAVQNRVDRNITETGVDELVNRMSTAILGDREAGSVQELYVNMLRNQRFNLTDAQRQDVESLINYFVDFKEGQ